MTDAEERKAYREKFLAAVKLAEDAIRIAAKGGYAKPMSIKSVEANSLVMAKLGWAYHMEVRDWGKFTNPVSEIINNDLTDSQVIIEFY